MHSSIENLNYATDARVRAASEEPIGDTITIHDYEADEEYVIPIPDHAYTWSVCDMCNGEGKHVNPSIDSNGLTAEDFHDDPDFAEEYMRGTFDVTCARCHGRTTVKVIDYSAFLSERELKLLEEQARLDAEYEAERLSEIRMGA